MAGSPRAEDLVLIACEYATNAIRHSPSGRPGGEFTVRVQLAPGWARLEVGDCGEADWVAPPPDPGAESGRGLIVVAAHADICGHQRGCTWAEVTWHLPCNHSYRRMGLVRCMTPRLCSPAGAAPLARHDPDRAGRFSWRFGLVPPWSSTASACWIAAATSLLSLRL